MAISNRTQRALKIVLADPAAAAELLSKIIATKAAAIPALTVTPTTGSLPAVGGTVVIANTATPTNVELLDLSIEILAKVDAIRAALTGANVTA